MMRLIPILLTLQNENSKQFNTALDDDQMGVSRLDKKLIDAVNGNDLSRAQYYLDKGADPSANYGMCFKIAANNGRDELLRLLIRYDQDDYVYGNWPLLRDAMIHNGNEDVVQTLLKYNNIENQEIKESIWYPLIKAIANKS